MKKRLLLVGIIVIAALLVVSCGEKSDFTYEKVDGGIAITGYTGESKTVVIPEAIGKNKVVGIGEGAFDASLIESVEIPESVTEIGKYAFRRSGYLTSVKINGDVKVIPEGAFNYCSSLAEITLPDTVESIEENAFGKTGLKSIVLPDSVKKIGDYAFYDCHALTSFTSGSGLEAIGNNTFGICSHLTEVKLNEGLKTIGEYAFSGCSLLKEIAIPSTVDKLAMGVLAAMSFEEYTVSDGIKTIETYAFASCEKLKKIYIPNTVERMEADVFDGCKGVVICGVRDSEAEIFADTYGFKFEEYNFG